MAVMMNAMYTSANSTYKFDAPVCPTGNCDWPTFGSLAICSQTNDITDQLRTWTGQTQVCWQNSTANKLQPWNWGPPVCQNITYSGLPNGLYLDYSSGNFQANTSNIWLSAKGDPTAWSKVYSFENDTFGPNALNAVQVVYLDSLNESYYNASSEVPTLPNSTVFLNHSRASETLFYICAQTYDVSTKNGTAMTAINATSHSINDTQSVTVTDDSRHYNIYTYHTFILDGQNYSYHALDWDLGNMLNEFANGSYSQDASGGGLGSDTPFSYAVGNALYQTVNVNTPNATGDGLMRQALSGMVDNMAKGLTNWYASLWLARLYALTSSMKANPHLLCQAPKQRNWCRRPCKQPRSLRRCEMELHDLSRSAGSTICSLSGLDCSRFQIKKDENPQGIGVGDSFGCSGKW